MKDRLLMLCDAQDWRCYYCGEYMTATVPGGDVGWTDATTEHRTPRSIGGKSRGNLAAACRRCNEREGVLHEQHRQRRKFEKRSGRYLLARVASVDPSLSHLFGEQLPAYLIA